MKTMEITKNRGILNKYSTNTRTNIWYFKVFHGINLWKIGQNNYQNTLNSNASKIYDKYEIFLIIQQRVMLANEI